MRTKSRYARIARLYDFLDLPFEYGRYRPLRRELFGGLSGRILDAGVGTGRNMPFYPAGAEVVAIDASAEMLARARARRDRLGARVELLEMDALRTAFPDACFDAVVAAFLFCVLDEDEQLPALRELGRVCKPGGEIRILEYAYPSDPLRRFVMRLWAPWVRFAYGAGFDRNTESYAGAAGLAVSVKRWLFRDIIKLLVMKPRQQ
ncbi:MAG TPA: methyltransferase domain-containing protein [Alphaproteobacteria bacterium]|jgi:ubiquinone/menaquinone biosynthesis C-methylase UbiE|nr:methyltransferase domain-containing protein [Alphaproteobacteria bacterium]